MDNYGFSLGAFPWNGPHASPTYDIDGMADLWEEDRSRLLQSNSTSSSTQNDAVTLRNTLRFYGSIFVVFTLLFCYLRTRYPRVYNVRNWVATLKIPLAADQFGFASWLYRVWLVSDYEMLDECGMDALCYTRVLEFGLKLSLVGMFVGVWLMPVYATASSDITNDLVVALSTSNVPSGSKRLVATVVAAYVVFGYCMYNMLQEFEWFYLYRYEFLKKATMPRNFSVYVRNIPDEYLPPGKFRRYFAKFASDAGSPAATAASDGVQDACISLKIPNLKKKVAERAAVLAKLEHAINVEDVTGEIPRQKKDNARVVDVLYGQLKDLNTEISASIDRIGDMQRQQQQQQQAVAEDDATELHPLVPSITLRSSSNGFDGVPNDEEGTGNGRDNDNGHGATGSTDDSFTTNETPLYGGRFSRKPPPYATTTTDEQPRTNDAGVGNEQPQTNDPETTTSSRRAVMAAMTNMAGGVVKVATTTAGSALALLSSEDGQSMTAGFVTFESLQAVYAARQMKHYPQPFAMEVLEAPGVDDINWANVGKTHKQLQVGMLLSMTLTTLLCLFWTVPMSFISTLSSIQGLEGVVPGITDVLEAAPWLEPFLVQLAPLLIVVAGILLRMLLEALSGLEGPVSGAVVQASTFSKLAAFSIIQTFFVTAISGSLVSMLSQLSDMAQDPLMIVNLLAQTLPTMSTFYIQILIVQTSISLVVELLRVVPVVMAGIRGCLGPKLTEEERDTPYMGIKPLADPGQFSHADMLAGTVLYFLVYFVYATLAPITSFFMFACFLFIGSGYRHQVREWVPDDASMCTVASVCTTRSHPLFRSVAVHLHLSHQTRQRWQAVGPIHETPPDPDDHCPGHDHRFPGPEGVDYRRGPDDPVVSHHRPLHHLPGAAALSDDGLSARQGVRRNGPEKPGRRPRHVLPGGQVRPTRADGTEGLSQKRVVGTAAGPRHGRRRSGGCVRGRRPSTPDGGRVRLRRRRRRVHDKGRRTPGPGSTIHLSHTDRWLVSPGGQHRHTL